MKRLQLPALVTVSALFGLVGCAGGGARPVETVQSAGHTITLSTPSGKLTDGKNDLTVTFADATGKPVDVQAQGVRFFMPAMGTMAAMSAEAPLEPIGKPGAFKGSADIPMKGSWQTTITYQDAAGQHRAVFNTRAL